MENTTKITLDTETYFKLVGLKAKLKAKTWAELVEKIRVRIEECAEKKYPPIY